MADRLTILRRGKVTAEGVPVEGMSREQLATLMVGREVIFNQRRSDKEPGEVILTLENLNALNNKNLPALHNVNLELRRVRFWASRVWQAMVKANWWNVSPITQLSG